MIELLPDLRALEVAIHQACIRGDGIRLGELLHPCFCEFGCSGRVYSRTEVIDAFADRPQAYDVLSEDFQCEQLAAGLALLTYRSARLTADGSMEHQSLRSSLWELTERGWQLRFHQGTPTEAFHVRDGSLTSGPSSGCRPTVPSTENILVRQAQASDSDFAYQTLERTMREYALATRGKWLEAEAREQIAADAASGGSQIIQLGPELERVGLLRVDRFATHFQLDSLYIVPEYQRRGVGTYVLQAILSEARAVGLPVRLRVLRVNPARRFYERYGFRVISETPERFFMECEWTLPDTPLLETARLALRPLRLEDAPAVQRQFAHWEVVRWLDARVPWPYPADGAELHIRKCLAERAQGKRFFWAICLKDAPEELVGGIDLWPDDGSRDQRGFWIASEFQGRGLMTEAADRVTEYAFRQLGWPHLWLTNAEDNLASSRIKQRQGARLVAKVEKQYVSGKSCGEVWLLECRDWKRLR